MFELRVSPGAAEKSPGWEKPHAKTVAWSYDMEGHARKSSLKDIVSWRRKRHSSYTKSQVLAWRITISRKRNFNRLQNGQKYAHKLSSNACTWHELVDMTFCGRSTSLQQQSQNGRRHVANAWLA